MSSQVGRAASVNRSGFSDVTSSCLICGQLDGVWQAVAGLPIPAANAADSQSDGIQPRSPGQCSNRGRRVICPNCAQWRYRGNVSRATRVLPIRRACGCRRRHPRRRLRQSARCIILLIRNRHRGRNCRPPPARLFGGSVAARMPTRCRADTQEPATLVGAELTLVDDKQAPNSGNQHPMSGTLPGVARTSRPSMLGGRALRGAGSAPR